MNINQVRQIAKQRDINTYRMKKIDLIHRVQCSEKNIECFATERVVTCNEHACLWREDCISANNRQ